jgi:hypothetical protein
MMASMSNPAGAVDAPIASLFHFVCLGRRATDQQRWAYQMCLLVIVCFLALSSLAADDLSRDWKRHLGVEEEFANSKCVFVGKVINSRQIMDKEGFIQGTFYVVRIAELLRGSPLKEVEIYDENSSGRFPMRVGKSYLLFAYEATFEGVEGFRLAISNCGNSATLKQAKKELAMVRKLQKAQPSGPGNSRHASQLNAYENRLSRLQAAHASAAVPDLMRWASRFA